MWCQVETPDTIGEFGQLEPFTDSSFCLLIDSVKMVLYDSDSLETVYTTPLSIPGHPGYSYGGPYARRIGPVNTGLLPYCILGSCIYTASEGMQHGGDLRCYHDAHTSIKLVSDTCNKGIRASVATLARTEISVSPNPATQQVFINGTGQLSHVIMRITDMQGKGMLEQVVSTGRAIDISSLSPGIYMLHVTHEQGNTGCIRLSVLPY